MEDKITTVDTINSLAILPRRDFEENWLKNNPILKEREIAVSIDKDTICYKVGDGESSYSALPFVDLFKAITLGYVYLPDKMIAGFEGIERLKLSIVDKEILNYFKENNITTVYDVFGRALIKN